MLCAALAVCLDSTIRMIAERPSLLNSLEVDVTAEVDVRGTLLVDRTVPVGFQSMQCHVDVQAAEGTDSKLVQRLLAAAVQSCVVLQALRSGVCVESSFSGVSRRIIDWKTLSVEGGMIRQSATAGPLRGPQVLDPPLDDILTAADIVCRGDGQGRCFGSVQP